MGGGVGRATCARTKQHTGPPPTRHQPPPPSTRTPPHSHIHPTQSINDQDTSFTCANGLRANPDYSQVGYNRDGIFVTSVAICEEELTSRTDAQLSAMIFAFPKWAVYGVSACLG